MGTAHTPGGRGLRPQGVLAGGGRRTSGRRPLPADPPPRSTRPGAHPCWLGPQTCTQVDTTCAAGKFSIDGDCDGTCPVNCDSCKTNTTCAVCSGSYKLYQLACGERAPRPRVPPAAEHVP